jgi:hypothetical protein
LVSVEAAVPAAHAPRVPPQRLSPHMVKRQAIAKEL